MNHGYHNTFVISIVVIIVIFVFLLLGCMAMYREKFTNPGALPMTPSKLKRKFEDNYVPSNLGYSDITGYYNSLDEGLAGTSMVNVSAIDSKRFPIMLEIPTNWYNTQPMVLKSQSLGSNNGKLPKSDCLCDNTNSLEFDI